MLNMKKKNAITLLALVLTIVILLLLAAIAIQMTLGENGLIAKSTQAQKEQAKAELLELVKMEYSTLNIKASAAKQEKPEPEEVLLQEEFKNKYDVVGENIADKKGNIIATKAEVLSGLKILYPKNIENEEGEASGIEISEEDRRKLILKIIVKDRRIPVGLMNFYAKYNPGDRDGAVKVDYGNGETAEITGFYSGGHTYYDPGEYIMKVENMDDFLIAATDYKENLEIEVIHWGEFIEKNEENDIRIHNVTKIYEPEPDRIPIKYINSKFTEIPEWLFSKKVTSKKMSSILHNKNLESIPKDLFKNNVNIEIFKETFVGCTGLSEIPEGLFKNNVNVEIFEDTFEGCTGLTSIPENIFKYNIKVKRFSYIISACTGIEEIPENMFRYNTEVKVFDGIFFNMRGVTKIPENIFRYNTEVERFRRLFAYMEKIKKIPENLFKYNINVKNFDQTFENMNFLEEIPEGIFKNNVNAEHFYSVFSGCNSLKEIPEGLFKNNIKALSFNRTFQSCNNLKAVPNNLFVNNTKAKEFGLTFADCQRLETIGTNIFPVENVIIDLSDMFSYCEELKNIPNEIIEYAKKVKEKGGDVNSMFKGCTKASNYSSLPGYLIRWS